MAPNLPTAALPILGPDASRDGRWGNVPWHDAVRYPEPLHGLRDGSVILFPYRTQKSVLQITCANNDLDGAGGSTAVDPSYEPGTTLRLRGGGACDSRKFPGVVLSPAMKVFGVQLGDFCLVTWGGRVEWAQYYDVGPPGKEGEFSLYLGRRLGFVGAAESDHRAALCGRDIEDVCTLIFPGSGPHRALSVADVNAGAAHCWRAFTGRKEAA